MFGMNNVTCSTFIFENNNKNEMNFTMIIIIEFKTNFFVHCSTTRFNQSSITFEKKKIEKIQKLNLKI